MSFFFFIGIFFLGACVGSFGAVLMEESGSVKRSFWNGRSQCLSCKKILTWYELIPLISYPLQEGKCRTCHAKIPRWIWYTEWYTAFLWMIGAMMLDYAGVSPVVIGMYLIILSFLSFIAISDIRLRIIPDTLSIPLICIISVCIGIWYYLPQEILLPVPTISIIGAFVGMGFYMIQMLIPAMWAVFRRHTYRDLWTLAFAPFLFPAWMITKTCIGEEKADKKFPSLSIFEELPTWVWGGDIRLGFIVGALVGPYDFVFIVMYGYVAGTIYFLFKLFVSRVRMQTMPVAPLLFIGICIFWCLRIFS